MKIESGLNPLDFLVEQKKINFDYSKLSEIKNFNPVNDPDVSLKLKIHINPSHSVLDSLNEKTELNTIQYKSTRK